MAGIYIHIPFCRKTCHYCNFHFSTSFDSYRTRMIDAICEEIQLQKDYFDNIKTPIQTIYFGGGTPSILSTEEFQKIWDSLDKNFNLNSLKEVTLEANPDDMNDSFFHLIESSAINRLSIGVQSFDNLDLAYLNRIHDSSNAIRAIENAIHHGVENISVDLIFGIPTSGISRLEKDIRMIANLGIQHISVYGLTVEPETALAHLIRRKKSVPVDEKKSAKEMFWLMEFLPKLGYEQYEISNYSLPESEAKHNSLYWNDIPYLGIGPSAHSYLKPKRSWNISNNMKYIESIEKRKLPQEFEVLDTISLYNEWIMTKIRLREGIQSMDIKNKFGMEYVKKLRKSISPYIYSGDVVELDNSYKLTTKGKLITDSISVELFES